MRYQNIKNTQYKEKKKHKNITKQSNTQNEEKKIEPQ